MNGMQPMKKIRPQRGFSLTELLVVIGIMAILAVASVPAINAISGSGQVTQTVYEISGMLEQARQYAVAQNTFVWVVFYYPSESAEQVSIAVVASKDGTDPTISNGIEVPLTGTVPNTTIDLLSRVRTFQQVKLKNTVTGTSLPNLHNGTPDALAGSASLNIKIPGVGTQAFNRAIKFTPTGQARVTTTPTEAVDFGLEPVKANAKNVAVIRINGLTGENIVYRN